MFSEWCIGDTLGGAIVWFWTSDAKFDANLPMSQWLDSQDKGFGLVDEDKNAAYEAACPSGLEFRYPTDVFITIGHRAKKLILDRP